MNETLVTNQLSGFLRLEQVLQLIPVSKATWWNGCRSGQFPKPYKLAPRVTAWKANDIRQWIERFDSTYPATEI
ncbi:helix-turn-helix transcriptional regulator [Spirosoma foliorum]|uniref:AlpA family phage regulatory protein n=1 Tax=Spirosoma foliorum TaxID=2710596 RepID=A0A7G5GRJ4_9BACT|nr:AlpA family phage regulatory protein [Spirosoma foliorum]QMW01486.1 AlpA family phage regulatory protein [Spirosoma foliorum]